MRLIKTLPFFLLGNNVRQYLGFQFRFATNHRVHGPNNNQDDLVQGNFALYGLSDNNKMGISRTLTNLTNEEEGLTPFDEISMDSSKQMQLNEVSVYLHKMNLLNKIKSLQGSSDLSKFHGSDGVEKLLNSQGFIDEYTEIGGFYSLLPAVRARSLAKVQAFFKQGDEFAEHYDKEGYSALHLSVYHNSEKIFCFLFHEQNAILLTCNNNGDNVLHTAIRKQITFFFEQLRTLNINDQEQLIHKRNNQGLTPIMLAIEKGYYLVVATLLRSYTDLSCELNPANETLIQQACSYLKNETSTTARFFKPGTDERDEEPLLFKVNSKQVFKTIEHHERQLMINSLESLKNN
jgi:hypothetical protein